MATYNTSVTSSIKYIPFNLSASEGLTVTVDNPLQGSSYITLESYRDQNGFYPAGTPKNTQGTYTLSGISNIVQDDYKAGFVVKPGGGTITFNNTNYVSGSNLQVRGTEYHPFYNTLLDRWPNAAAAYSLRLLNSYYEGPAVRVRRSIDNNEINVGFNPVELDTATLETWVTNPGTALPADYGDGAAAAYSLRYVSSTYSGPVIRVRRSSDNNELNFTPSEITDGTLEAWVGVGNNGFVTTWYNQSGNGNNATQTTAASQPQIVSSGSVILENGKPALSFDGTDDHILADISGFNSITNLSTTFVTTPLSASSPDSNTMTLFGFGNANDRALTIASYTSLLSGETIANVFDDGTSRRLGSSTYSRGSNQQSLFTSYHLQTGVSIFSQGNSISLNLSYNMTTSTPASPSDTGYVTDNIVYINALKASNIISIGPAAKHQEIIFYPSDQSSNRTDIESNINNYYNIFPFNAYVTTWYDQSGNGYNATQSTAVNQPQIVSSGSFLGYIEMLTNKSNQVLTTALYYSVPTAYSIFSVYQNFGNGAIGATSTSAQYFGAIESGSINLTANSFSVQNYYKNGSVIGNTRNDLYNATINFALISSLVTKIDADYFVYMGYTSLDYNRNRFKEFIIYPNQTVSRAGVENNIITYYDF